MKKIMLWVLLATVLAGCEDFPIEGGDDFAGTAHHGVRAGHPDGRGEVRLVGVASGG
jgi:hypothetical protein